MSPNYFQFSNDYGIPVPAAGSGVRFEGYFFRRFRGLIYPWSKDNSSVIGRGGSGVIHLVRDEVMERDVALKLPNESIMDEPEVRNEVLNEASQALELTHPNIVRIFDFHDQDRRWGISMQFVRGKSLDRWREKLAPNQVGSSSYYDVEQISPWIQQLCDALSYAHEEVGIVHCDIKPPNLLLERWYDTRMRMMREKLLLTDFGITQKLRDFTTRTQRHRGRGAGSAAGSGSEEGGAAGTLAYMSPQQLAGKEGAVADDIYAVGMTIYELLTSKPAFYQGDVKLIHHHIENTAPPPMMERRKEREFKLGAPIPAVWEQVTAQCLHKDPAKRPASIRELMRLLGLSNAQTAGLSLEEQRRLQREADGLKNQMETQTVQITTLTHRVGELETASSGKVEEAALVAARGEIEDLQAALSHREAQLRVLDDKIQDSEEARALLMQKLEELKAATIQVGTQGSEEKEMLQNSLLKEQKQTQQLQTERDEALAALQQKESELAALRAQHAAEAEKVSKASGQVKSVEARVRQAEEKAEETRKRLEAAKKEEVEKIRKSAAETEAKARQAAAEAAEAEAKARKAAAEAEARARQATTEAEAKVRKATTEAEAKVRQATTEAEAKARQATADLDTKARQAISEAEIKVRQTNSEAEARIRQTVTEAEAKVRQAAAEAEKASQQLESLTSRQAAPLRPVLTALLGIILGGLVLGGVMGMVLGGGGGSQDQGVAAAMAISAEARSESGLLVRKRHVQAWLAAIGVAETEISAPFAALPADAPATGLSWLEAAAFAEWLTVAAGLNASKEWYDLPALADMSTLSTSTGPAREWTREEAPPGADQPAAVSRSMMVYVPGGAPLSSFARSERANDIGFHIVLRQAAP